MTRMLVYQSNFLNILNFCEFLKEEHFILRNDTNANQLLQKYGKIEVLFNKAEFNYKLKRVKLRICRIYVKFMKSVSTVLSGKENEQGSLNETKAQLRQN